MSVFRYLKYKDYIDFQLKSHSKVHGYRSRLAEAAGCQKSFFSKVMSGPTHLTAEHGIGLALYWNLTELETEYFVQLVNLERAGVPALKKQIAMQLEKLRREQDNLAKRFSEASSLSEKDAAVYYSAWQYLAIHFALSIPELQTAEAIGRRFNCSGEVVRRTLTALKEMGLVESDGQRWKMNGRSYHLPRDSQFTQMNHANWRARAVQNSFERNPRDIHYTTVGSISLDDVEKIRQLTLNYIDQGRAAMSASGTEELFCMSCDFFLV